MRGKGKSGVGKTAPRKKLGRIDQEIYPLASAILCRSIQDVSQIMKRMTSDEIDVVAVERSSGEKYTGGTSCPVHCLTCKSNRESGEVSLVAKVVEIDEDHPWKRDIKCRSYNVELAFYKSAIPVLLASGAAVPSLVCSEVKPKGTVFTFVLTDLRNKFPHHPQGFSWNTLVAAARWLASLHAAFWGCSREPPGLWSCGSHWDLEKHGEDGLKRLSSGWAETLRWLGKRSSELAADPAVRALGSRLQAAAVPISRFAHGEICKVSWRQFRTVIHGDAKPANFFFTDGGSRAEAAACDFQFAGEGYGAADLAYMLFPDANSDLLDREEELLGIYHAELSQRLGHRGAAFTPEVLRRHYAVAQLDFFRHFVGKSGWVASRPADAELVRRMSRGLAALDGGECLSPKEYELRLLADYG